MLCCIEYIYNAIKSHHDTWDAYFMHTFTFYLFSKQKTTVHSLVRNKIQKGVGNAHSFHD